MSWAHTRRARAWPTVALLALASCVYMRPMFSPGEWDRHAGGPPLAVRGVEPSAPGPTILRALERERAIATLIESEGEPDTLEVVGARYSPKRIVLTYAGQRPRRIVLEPTNQGYVARAPEPLPTVAQPLPTPTPARQRRPSKPRPKASPAPAAPHTPSAKQRLECPIDPARPECQALCTPGAAYEWCR